MKKTVSENQIKKELHKNGAFFVGTILAILFICWAFKPEDALTKCQETHSFDTCFSQLNR